MYRYILLYRLYNIILLTPSLHYSCYLSLLPLAPYDTAWAHMGPTMGGHRSHMHTAVAHFAISLLTSATALTRPKLDDGTTKHVNSLALEGSYEGIVTS